MGQLIITVAPNGSVPTKRDTPHVPIAPDEVIEDGIACSEVGPGALWNSIGVGKAQLPVSTLGMILGGHCRVVLQYDIHYPADPRHQELLR